MCTALIMFIYYVSFAKSESCECVCVCALRKYICTQLQIYMAESTLIYLLTCHHHLHILVYK